MAYDFRKVSSHGDEQTWTSSIYNEEDKLGLVSNATDANDDDDRCNSFANILPSSTSQDVSKKLNFPLLSVFPRALRNAISRRLPGNENEAQAPPCQASRQGIKQDDQTRKRYKGKGLLQVKASDDDESTRCIVTAGSYSDNSSFSEEEVEKRRCDPWVASLIVLISLILGLGAFAAAYFLPDIMGKESVVKDYEEIEYSPTNISVSPSTGDSTSITFYAMADAPYTDHERENIMPHQIKNLSNTADFLMHLGDLQDAADGCQEYAYKAASDILKQSSIPVFVVPGQEVNNDINDCADFEHGKEKWREHFHLFDENWKHDFSVSRWGEIGESFAFLRNRILFFGLNIVGGYPHSDHEWKSRHAEHLHRVKELMTKHQESFDVAVLLAHASPRSNHEDFFEDDDGLARFIQRTGKPFLHLHGDDHVYSETEAAFGVENYMMISLDCGEIASPIKVEIDTSQENPIKISRENDKLEVECCTEGWPLKELS